MKRLIILAGACLLTACSSWPEYDGWVGKEQYMPGSHSIRIYDEDGTFIGSIDERSNMIFDRDGKFIGRIQK